MIKKIKNDFLLIFIIVKSLTGVEFSRSVSESFLGYFMGSCELETGIGSDVGNLVG